MAWHPSKALNVGNTITTEEDCLKSLSQWMKENRRRPYHCSSEGPPVGLEAVGLTAERPCRQSVL